MNNHFHGSQCAADDGSTGSVPQSLKLTVTTKKKLHNQSQRGVTAPRGGAVISVALSQDRGENRLLTQYLQ